MNMNEKFNETDFLGKVSNTYIMVLTAIMTDNISEDQIAWIVSNCSCVIWVGDNDSRGLEAREKARQKLRNKVTFKIVDYPDYGKDVCDWTDEEIDRMIASAHSSLIRKVKRI